MSDAAAPSDAFLLFGATGDLAKKKLWPALYELTREGRMDMPIIGIARSDWGDEEMRDRARESVRAQVCLLYTSPSPRDQRGSRMPSSA